MTPAVEAALVVAGSVWLLGPAQRRLTSRAPLLAGSARAAYAAFMLQVPVLLSLEIAARPFPWPPLVKAVLVGTRTVAASSGLGVVAGEACAAGQSSKRALI